MKFHPANAAGQNVFTGYGDDYVSINNERYSHPVLVSPAHAVTRWHAEQFETLTAAQLEAVLELNPEIVILGTGSTLRFPKPELTRAIAHARVGLEVMDTKAACRTYNILAAEGRQVVAAILL